MIDCRQCTVPVAIVRFADAVIAELPVAGLTPELGIVAALLMEAGHGVVLV